MTPTRLSWPAIAQVGPDPSAVGGMETVIRTYARLLAAHTDVSVIPSWCPGARASGAGRAVTAARTIAALDRDALVHVHVSHRGAFLREGALVAAAARRRRVFVTVHGSGFVATGERWGALYAAVLRRATGVAVLNAETMDAVRRLAPHTPVTLLPNPGPVPDDWIPAAPAAECGPTVLFAGEVSYRKGVDVLLRAWPSVRTVVPDARLLVAGPDYGVDVTGVDGVHALGPVAPERIRALLGESRVAVLPSRAEGMPMWVLEAMAAGRPVVGTTVGAMPDMLAGAGLVVPPGEAGALAGGLVAYLRDAGLAGRDGAAGRARYLRSHSPGATLERLAEFYGVAGRSGR